MAKKKTINPNTNKAQRSASHSGFHFVDLYSNCPRKFFIKYILRIEPTYTAAPLIAGTAFHEGKAVFYNTKSPSKAINRCEREFRERKAEYHDLDRHEKDSLRFPILLEKWIEEYGKRDLIDMEFIMVEQELSVPIKGTNGFKATLRPDLVFRYKGSSNIYVMDTKTSSHSIGLTQNSLYYGDQATMYIMGVTRALGEPVMGLIADIAYWNKSTMKQSNISCIRGDLITRTDKQIDEFEENLCGIFNEISQKVGAFSTGKFSEHVLFPRHTYYCMSYAKKCEYADICRTSLPIKGRAPNEFRRTPKSKKRSFGSYTFDIETVM